MSIWDQPGVAPKPTDDRFVKWEIPGTEVAGQVTGAGVKNWPAADGKPPRTDPEFTIRTADGDEKVLNVSQWKLRQALFDHRLDVGDMVRIRYVGKVAGSNTKTFEVNVRKIGEAASPPAVAVPAGGQSSPASDTALPVASAPW